MRLYHNSQDINYRTPFGAVAPNTEITISIRAFEPWENLKAELSLWSEQLGEIKLNMRKGQETKNEILFSVTFRANDVPGLIWYFFEVSNDREKLYYGNNEDQLGGEGKVYASSTPKAYQITVYQPRRMPEWYKNAIVYQIFPDRFHRGSDFIARTSDCLKTEKRGRKHIVRQEWNDQPEYRKNTRGEVTHWDFFGGTLQGIEEKLDYLKQLGVSVLYLNPIFEASSNHRYDTADFKKIDPRLGDGQAFSSLCKKAEEKGIHILLDGVFNHAGCDSIYYDQYGNYGGTGAYGNKKSKYASWFEFEDEEHKNCKCWWGTKDLPNFNKEDKNYQEYIYAGKDAVIKYWLRLGAKGWRLDVADELTDEFIQGIKTAILETDNEGILLGEVWEDASNKISYGKMRKYLLGNELDSVMNYPFRTILVGFLCGSVSAMDAVKSMFSLYENYPKENFYVNLNLIGSHDRGRILTILGKGIQIETAEDKSYEALALSEGEKELAIRKLRLLVLMQMTHPGVPCIYYGDEIGLEGGTDPYNRATFDWERKEERIGEIYRNAIALRKEYPVFVEGSFEPVSFGEDVYGYRRKNDEDEVIILFNRCPYHSTFVKLNTGRKNAFDLFNARHYEVGEDGDIQIELPILGAACLCLEEEKKSILMEKGVGILCHVSSISSRFGTGTLGQETKKFLVKLKAANQTYWQLLPLNPTDKVGSPYSSPSAFAGNIMLIDLDELTLKGLLTEKVIEYTWTENNKRGELDLENVKKHKLECLRKAYLRFQPDLQYQEYLSNNAVWLEDDSWYHAIKKRFQDAPWQEWPKEYKDRLDVMYQDEDLRKEASFYCFCQYVFDQQWQEIKQYAKKNNVMIIGDLPFYMREDSADVWAHRSLFHIDENGYFTESAGVPPDYFSMDGQIWNVPTYRWSALEDQGYTWWINRLKQAFWRYDYVRLDHFRGFEQYFSVPKDKTAKEGYWSFGPGRKLFHAMRDSLGELPIIAEDLGQITVTVNDLTHLCGFDGMDVFQFSVDERYYNGIYQAKENAILYSGTHDNETLKGWCIERDVESKPEAIIRALYESKAPVVILQMQDLLGLDNSARMNVPGTTIKNWKWSFSLDEFSEECIAFYRQLVKDTGRK